MKTFSKKIQFGTVALMLAAVGTFVAVTTTHASQLRSESAANTSQTTEPATDTLPANETNPTDATIPSDTPSDSDTTVTPPTTGSENAVAPDNNPPTSVRSAIPQPAVDNTPSAPAEALDAGDLNVADMNMQAQFSPDVTTVINPTN